VEDPLAGCPFRYHNILLGRVEPLCDGGYVQPFR
jgi:hypothetical protein